MSQITIKLTCICVAIISIFISIFMPQQSEAQQKVSTNKVQKVIVEPQQKLIVDGINLKTSHMDELEIKPLNEFQVRVRERYNEVLEKGTGRALLLQPFSTKYRVYKFRVVNQQAVQGDIVLGDLRDVIRRSISNRDAGIKAGHLATSPLPGTNFPPPIIADAVYRWPNGDVPYEIKSGDFSSSQTTTIKNGIATLNNSTNMNLKTRTDKDKDYVLIVGDNDLVGSGQSSVGRQSGKQKLTLNTSKKGGFSEGTIQHEFMHAFGFNHEQTRADRNRYIEVITKNIIDGLEHNFEIDDTRAFGDYNYNSIMHYHETAFGRKCKISDYSINSTCSDCSIPAEQDFINAMQNGVACNKITLRSKTASNIRPSNSLTQDDIGAINAVYPSNTTPKSGNTLPPITAFRTFSLTLEKIKRVAGTKGESGAVCGKYPDFIGELVAGDTREIDTGQDQDGILMINDTSLSKKKAKDKKVGDTVTPNWTLDVPVGPDTKELYLIVKVWDYDDAICGGKNDLVDISPQKDQGYLRLIVNLENGELQHMRPQSATALDNVIYYERAQYTGRNIFDAITGTFVSSTFSGLDDKSALGYQLEASVTIKGTIK